MAFIGSLEDKIAIHELVAEYGDAVSRRDRAGFTATWAVDGVWHLPWLEPVHGRENISEVWAGQIANYPFHNFSGYLGSLEITGDRATGRLWTSEIVSNIHGQSGTVTGLYEDEFVKVDGKWLFASKKFTPLHGMDSIVTDEGEAV